MVKVLLTAIGCPGGVSMIKALKRENVHVVGTDIKQDVVAANMVDDFYVVLPGMHEDYMACISDIMFNDNIDVVIPQSNVEALVLADATDLAVPVLAPNAYATAFCCNKAETYSQLSRIIPVMPYRVCNRKSNVMSAMAHFGAPPFSVVVKPAVGEGNRGFRFLSPVHNKLGDWRKWPAIATMTHAEFIRALPMSGMTYPLLVMLPATGLEYVEAYCSDGEILAGFIRHVELLDATGTACRSTVIDNPELWDYARKIVRHLGGPNYFINVQFMGGKLMEINPRVSTMIYTTEFNLPWLGIQHALGHLSADDLRHWCQLPVGCQATYYWDIWQGGLE